MAHFIYYYSECNCNECHYAERRYAERRYAERRYAECRGAKNKRVPFFCRNTGASSLSYFLFCFEKKNSFPADSKMSNQLFSFFYL